MALKTISLIFAIFLAFNIAIPNQLKDMPFDANDVLNQVSHHRYPTLDLTGEFLIDTNIVYVGALYGQYYPSIAFDGTNYFVVWADFRSTSYTIYGTRVSQIGMVLDPTGIPISNGAGNFPSVAFDGTNYLVVWHRGDIYGARVSQDGIVLDLSDIAISVEVDRQENPSVAFDGNNYLVVWRDRRSGYYDIYGARINQFGIVIDSNGIAISTAVGDQYFPSVAFDGTNYFVVWQDVRSDPSDIYGARVNQSGEVLDSNGIAISTADSIQAYPSVAFDGTNYLVVWHDYRWGPSPDIYGARVNQAGIVLNPYGLAISTAINEQMYPSVFFGGNNYLVVWADLRNNQSLKTFGARVNRSGAVLDPNGIAISSRAGSFPSVGYDGTNYFVVWEDRYNYIEQRNIFGARINQAGIVLDPNGNNLSTMSNFQRSPSIAFGSTNYFIVWQDRRDEWQIFGIRVNHEGIILDSSSIFISNNARNPGASSVVSDGTNYLVVWQDYRNGDSSDIYGTRVNQTGIVLDPWGITISIAAFDQTSSSIAFDGTNYFVVWQDERAGEYESDIYGARINQAGVVLDPNGILISNAIDWQANPYVAFDGTNYLVVWEDWRNYPELDLFGTRVTQSGIVLDSLGFPISTATNYQMAPSIAFDGINYLVAWHDYRNSDTSDIYGTRVNQAGIILDTAGIAISTVINYQQQPSVTFDGTDYFIVWEDHRSGLDWDIYGARVSQSGAVIDTFPVSAQYKDQVNPALAHGAGNQILLTFSGWADSINDHPVNTMRIWGKFYPFVGIAEENSKVKMQTGKLLEVYPNPARSFLAVRLPFSADRQTLKIFDVAGKMIKEIEILRGVYPASLEKRDCFASARNDKRCRAQNDGVSDTKISLKGINPGIYFLRVGKETIKFIVAK